MCPHTAMYVDAAALASGSCVLVLLLHIQIHTCATYISSGLILVHVADHVDLEPHRPQGGGVTLCPRTTIFVSSQYYTCPHTTICVLYVSSFYVVYMFGICLMPGVSNHMGHTSAYYYVSSVYLSTMCVLIPGCVLILLHICPHTITTYVSSHSYMCVLTLLYVCPHTTARVLTLLYI